MHRQAGERHLVQGSHSLGQLGLDLGQRLGPLQGLLELLLGFIQPFLQLSVLLLALHIVRERERKNKIKPCTGQSSRTLSGYLKERDSLRHLSVQRLLAGQLVLQLVFDIMEGGRLPLGAEVPAIRQR